MPFSRRRLLSKQIEIFRRTGRVIALMFRIDPQYTSDVPSELFASATEPAEVVGEFEKIYIIGKYEEDAVEDFEAAGRIRHVKGIIIIPAIYKLQLQGCTYIDPYNDGVSRFRKVGGSIDEENVFVTQRIEAVKIKNVGEVE